MKIYTKTGDRGDTGLLGGGRVHKAHPRIEAFGTVDELNASLGVARASAMPPELDLLLARLQNELFELGAELARPSPPVGDAVRITEAMIATLEEEIDRFECQLAPLRQFILPGGCPAAAHLHLARTICRRAERRVLTLSTGQADSVRPSVVVYLNRLGDLLFVLARTANRLLAIPDVPWTG